jgi:DNA binding domain, excisionase family
MRRNKLTVKTIVITLENGLRIERDWDTIPEEEQLIISKNVTDRFMKAAGYKRKDEYNDLIQQKKIPSPSPVCDREENITLDAREAAVYLNIHYETLLRMARRNLIPHHRIGRKLLFRKESLDQWVRHQEQNK